MASIAIRNPPARPRLGRGWTAMAATATAVTLFSVPPYLLLDEELSRIPLNPAFPSHLLWLLAHAVPGGLALLLGPFLFLSGLRAPARPAPAARPLGRAYLLCIAAATFTGLVPACFSASGLAAQVALVSLACAWLGSGWMGYRTARARRFAEHRAWMVRNYSLTFIAVWLRAGHEVAPRQLASFGTAPTLALVLQTLVTGALAFVGLAALHRSMRAAGQLRILVAHQHVRPVRLRCPRSFRHLTS